MRSTQRDGRSAGRRPRVPAAIGPRPIESETVAKGKPLGKHPGDSAVQTGNTCRADSTCTRFTRYLSQPNRKRWPSAYRWKSTRVARQCDRNTCRTDSTCPKSRRSWRASCRNGIQIAVRDRTKARSKHLIVGPARLPYAGPESEQ